LRKRYLHISIQSKFRLNTIKPFIQVNMPKKNAASEISKYIFLVDDTVKFVIYRIDLVPTKDLYTNLEAMVGKDAAEVEYQTVIDEDAPPPSFVVGMGSTGGGIYDTVYALMYAEQTCFIGNDISLGEGNSVLYGAAGYSYTSSKEPEIEDNEITLNIDPQNKKLIQVIIDSFNTNFVLDTTDDDDEFIQPLVDLNKALKKFKKFDHVYTYDWDDLDDLLGLSKVWPFTLTFED